MTSYLRSRAAGAGKRSRAKRKKRLAKKRVCAICGLGLSPSEMTVDHIVPRSLGGSNEAWNLRAAHKRCNSARGSVMEDTAEVRTAAFIHRAFGYSRRV